MKIRNYFLEGDSVRHVSGKTGTVHRVDTWAVWVVTLNGSIEPWSKKCTRHLYTPVFKRLKTQIKDAINKYFSF